jgi:hypothetical protein
MAIVASPSKICIDVIKLQIRTGNAEHIDAELMVPVDVVGLIFLWWDHPDVASVKAPSCRWKSCNFIEFTRKFGTIIGPFNDVILQTNDAVSHAVDDPADSG